MKTAPILLSLIMGAATAQLEGDESERGNIRASKLTMDKITRGAADRQKHTPSRAAVARGHDHAQRKKRSQHKAQGDALHKKLKLNKERGLKEDSSVTHKTDDDNKAASKKAQYVAEGAEENRDLKKTDIARDEVEGAAEEDRELKKMAKSSKGGGWGGHLGGGRGSGGGSSRPGNQGYNGWGDDGFFGDDDDRFDDDDDRFGGRHYDDDDDRFGGSGGWDPSWGSGKSGKSGGSGSGGWDPSWGSGKSGKTGGSGSGGWDPSWGSGKSGKTGGSGSGGYLNGNFGGSTCRDQAWVTVTNLSFRQSFSEIFIMTALDQVIYDKPIYVFGNNTNSALARLSQDAEASEMENRYAGKWGVEQVKTFDSFRSGQNTERFLRGGQRATFKVRTSGLGHRLSLAVGLPFTNDGAVVLQGERIFDGAEYWIPAIDTGAEGNIQTCWSVAANQDDFPFNAECADDNDSNENDNSVPGETFVSMHRGIHDFDGNDDLKDLLFFPTCKDFDLDNNAGTQRFAEYFYEVGFDDDFLLCRNSGGAGCDPRDDENFLDYLDRQDDLTDDDRFVSLALASADFDDFCDLLKDANDDVSNALKTLEPWLFDWRNEMMHVEIECGWHDDVWDNGGWDASGDDRFF